MNLKKNFLNSQRDYAFDAVLKVRKTGPAGVLSLIKKSGLRGRGGAGFPTGLKWEATYINPQKSKYVVANGHEGEPETLKDMFLLENFPHLVIAGMLVAAEVIKAQNVYLVINKKYTDALVALKREIAIFNHKGLLKDIEFNIHLAENFYVGGEESALLNELEGKRVEPRIKPPFVADKGLFSSPTIVNNVETFANVPFIVNEGSGVFRKTGTQNCPGQKLVTISGAVDEPGVYEIDMKETLGEVIGLAKKGLSNIKFALTGGFSGTVVLPSNFSVPFNFDSFSTGVLLGAGTIIVYDKKTKLKDCLKEWLNFYRVESCGQCTPCREGSERLYEIVSKPGDKISLEDRAKMEEIFFAQENSSLCALGSSIPLAARGLLEKFRKELIGG